MQHWGEGWSQGKAPSCFHATHHAHALRFLLLGQGQGLLRRAGVAVVIVASVIGQGRVAVKGGVGVGVGVGVVVVGVGVVVVVGGDALAHEIDMAAIECAHSAITSPDWSVQLLENNHHFNVLVI